MRCCAILFASIKKWFQPISSKSSKVVTWSLSIYYENPIQEDYQLENPRIRQENTSTTWLASLRHYYTTRQYLCGDSGTYIMSGLAPAKEYFGNSVLLERSACKKEIHLLIRAFQLKCEWLKRFFKECPEYSEYEQALLQDIHECEAFVPTLSQYVS